MTLDPFPFAAPVELHVEHVDIPDRDWSPAAARRAVRQTSPTATSWRLVPPPATAPVAGGPS